MSTSETSIRELLKNTKVETLMNPKVVTVYEDQDVSDAHEKFVAYGVTHLIVLNRQDQLVGLLTPKYVYKTQSPRKILNEDMLYQAGILVDGDTFYEREMLDGFILRNMMKKSPFTLRRNSSAAEAVREMALRKLSCIPIVDKEKKVIGILTDWEIINFMYRLL